MRPFNSKIHPGGWRNFLDFANGTMGDWGVHWLDQVLWWSGEKGPKKIFCTGGRDIAGPAVLTDKEQTTDSPDHQLAVFEFEQFTATLANQVLQLLSPFLLQCRAFLRERANHETVLARLDARKVRAFDLLESKFHLVVKRADRFLFLGIQSE